MENKITEVIAGLYESNRYLLEKDLLSENEKEYYKNVKIGMSGDIAVGAVHQMACFMQRYYGENTLAAAHCQITEKKFKAELVSRGFVPEKIRSYGLAFRGRECLIG